VPVVLFQNTNRIFFLDTGSCGTKENLFHLASELLLHVAKMPLLLVLVVLNGYLRNLRGNREPIQRKAQASLTGPWSLEGISTQFARYRTHFKERCLPECTVFGKHCECIAQKCTHLGRLPPLVSHLLLLRQYVLTWYGGQKESERRAARPGVEPKTIRSQDEVSANCVERTIDFHGLHRF